jgi:hypothetical protein
MSKYRSTGRANSKIVTRAWQSGVYLQRPKEIPKTVAQDEYQTSYSRNHRRLCRSLGD